MIIELALEYYWESPAYYQRWPELLLKFPDVMSEKSKGDIAVRYGNFLKDEVGRVHFDEFYNLFGAETIHNGYRIYGSNLIAMDMSGFHKTREAKELELAYKLNENWDELLFIQVLKYSLRARAIFLALFNDGELVFPSGFMKGYKKAFLKYEDQVYYIFNSDKETLTLNNLLWQDPQKTLGQFWMESLGILTDGTFCITGVNGKDPSLHSLSSRLRNPLYLASKLKLFQEVNTGVYKINIPEAKRFIPSELLNSFGEIKHLNEIALLKELIGIYSEINGYFPVAIVGNMLKQRLDPKNSIDLADWIDTFFMTRIKEHKFTIIGYQQGQPRHGRGLLGNSEKQLIKLEF